MATYTLDDRDRPVLEAFRDWIAFVTKHPDCDARLRACAGLTAQQGGTATDAYGGVVSALMSVRDDADASVHAQLLATDLMNRAGIDPSALGPSGTIRTGPDRPEHRPHFMHEVLARCYACACSRARTPLPAGDYIESELARCLTAWRSSSVEFVAVAKVAGPVRHLPMDHLALQQAPLSFEGGVTLGSAFGIPAAFARAVDAERLRSIFSRLPLAEAALWASTRVPKRRPDDRFVESLTKLLHQAVTAIRIGTGIPVGIEHVLVGPSDLHFQTDAFPTWILPADVAAIEQRQCTRDCKHAFVVADAREVQRQLLRPEASSLQLAIERFNQALGRATLEDQLIDLTIALESTLLRGPAEGTIAFRFALYGTAIISGEHPEQVFKTFTAIYHARSKVVHAGVRLSALKATDLAGLPPEQLVDTAQEYTRLVLRELLQAAGRGIPPDGVVNTLKERLIQTLPSLRTEI